MDNKEKFSRSRRKTLLIKTLKINGLVGAVSAACITGGAAYYELLSIYLQEDLI